MRHSRKRQPKTTPAHARIAEPVQAVVIEPELLERGQQVESLLYAFLTNTDLPEGCDLDSAQDVDDFMAEMKTAYVDKVARGALVFDRVMALWVLALMPEEAVCGEVTAQGLRALGWTMAQAARILESRPRVHAAKHEAWARAQLAELGEAS